MPNCAVAFCRTSSASKSGIHLHRFPKDIERCKLWVDVCGTNSMWLRKVGLENLNTSAYRICSLHFTDSMYSDPNVKLYLKTSAVPTSKVFSNHQEDTSITGTLSVAQGNTSSNQSVKQGGTSSSQSKIRKKKKISKCKKTSKIDSRPAIITVTPEITCASMMNFHSDNSNSVDSWIKKEETEYSFQYVNTDICDEESLNGAELDNTDTLFSVSDMMCRLCLESGNNLHPFFTEESDKQDEYRETVLSSVPIKVEKDDGLPQCICESCYNSLVQWHDFKEMCMSSNIILKQYISNMSLSGNSEFSEVNSENPDHINPENNEPQSDFTKCARKLSEVTSNNKKIKVYNKRCRKEATFRKKMKTTSPLVDSRNKNENMDTSNGVDMCEISQSLENSPLSENLQILTDAIVNKHEESEDKLLLNNDKSFINVSSIDEPNMTSNDNLNKISSDMSSLNRTSNDLLISNNKLEQFIDKKSEYELLLNKTSVDKQLSNMTSNDKLLIKTADNKLLLIRTVYLTPNEKRKLTFNSKQ